MSVRVEFNQASVHVQRLQAGAWLQIKAATISGTSDYNLQDNSKGTPPSKIPTPIVGIDSANLTFVRYGSLGSEVLYAGDEVRVLYGSKVVFRGIIESVDITHSRDPRVEQYGEEVRIEVNCQVAGLYGALLSRTVSWTNLPAEPWITRIRRFVTVTGWPGGV